MTSLLPVVIVGAGLGGLMTANLLSQDATLNRPVRVFEARERVGGRLVAPDGLDLGGTWFWRNERRMHALVYELNVPVLDQRTHGRAVVEQRNGQGESSIVKPAKLLTLVAKYM